MTLVKPILSILCPEMTNRWPLQFCNFYGLQGTDLVSSNARSHTCLLAGRFLGDIQVLVRLSVGIDSQKQVAMKLAVRSEDPAVSDIIHEIINS